MHLYYTSFLATMALFLSTSAHSILVPEGEQSPSTWPTTRSEAPDILGPGIREAGERLRQLFQQHGANNLHQAFAAGQNHQPPAQEQ